MGVPDYWIKLIKDQQDEQWNIGQLFHELTTHRVEEKTISYTESHDQALVGDKTIFFRLVEKEIYDKMGKSSPSLVIDRGIALHKMIRLVTIATAGGGYLTFMGNEFGHPEWIDFPREGNNWSYHYARRQWNLADDKNLKFHWLLDFDKAMIDFIRTSGLYIEPYPYHLLSDLNNHVLAFKRNHFVFVFNFNPEKSFTGYGIPVEPGKYSIVLSTDESAFGGQDRIDTSMDYFSVNKGDITTLKNNYVNLYLPARTALVLKKIPAKKVYK